MIPLKEQIDKRKAERRAFLAESDQVRLKSSAEAIRDAAAYLKRRCIKFTLGNQSGNRIVISGMNLNGRPETIDYWPSSDHWTVRYSGPSGYGLASLIERVKP